MGSSQNILAEFTQPIETTRPRIFLRVELIPVNFLQEHVNLAPIENHSVHGKDVDQRAVAMTIGLEEAPNGWPLLAPGATPPSLALTWTLITREPNG